MLSTVTVENPQDLKIVEMLANGRTHKEIGTELKLSLKALKKHIDRICADNEIGKDIGFPKVVLACKFACWEKRQAAL